MIGKQHSEKISYKLLDRILISTGCDILVAKCNTQEERRIQWTTYQNLKSWFDNWEKDLVELGFAEVAQDGNVHIPNNQLMRILNVDETCLTLDGGSGQRDG